jgi:uncharacterized protein YbaP (TraB family)
MKKFCFLCLSVSAGMIVRATPPLEKTLLWQIGGPGISAPSFLFGTIHLMCPNDIIVPDALKEKFNSTRQLYMELDLDDPTVLLKTMQHIQMHNDTTLKDLLSPAEYDSLLQRFKRLTGMPLEIMTSMKPELVETLMYPALLGCDGAEAWEQKFMQMAKANHMEVKGLETVDDQLKIFDAIPYKTQAEELAATFDNIDSIKQNFNAMLDLYKQKDLEGLHAMMYSDEEFSQYDDLLLKNRNEKWIPEIIEEAKTKPTFFAVGAAHLAGPAGIIALLKEKGYTVEPVSY